MCKLLFVSMCSFFRITDKQPPFDLLSIILIYYVFIGIFFSFNKLELY